MWTMDQLQMCTQCDSLNRHEPTAMHSICIPTLSQILAMYPAEAIKVRCQRDGISAAKVLAQLAKQAAQHPGGTVAVVGQLYSGIGAAAVFSIAIGAVHCEHHGFACCPGLAWTPSWPEVLGLTAKV